MILASCGTIPEQGEVYTVSEWLYDGIYNGLKDNTTNFISSRCS
jgi:hypothetical protein